MVTSGHLNDTRPRWVTCPKCLGAGNYQPPPCYEPVAGLKHEVVAAMLAESRKSPTKRLAEIERKLESLQRRILKVQSRTWQLGDDELVADMQRRIRLLEKQHAGLVARSN